MTAPLLRQPPDDFCLGFVNTKFWRGTDQPTEQLPGPAELLAWFAAEGGWRPDDLPLLAPGWSRHQAVLFATAIALRETLWRALSTICQGGGIHASDLAALNVALAEAAPRNRLRPMGPTLLWELADASGVLLPHTTVLWSAGDLLTGPRLGKVRQCANPQCRWLFLDDSKSGNRRWCTMSSCGNRAKAQRHYLRQRRQAVT